jgi:hypothetical protein
MNGAADVVLLETIGPSLCVVLENHIRVCVASFEAKVYSSGSRPSPMDHPCRYCERLPWPYVIRLVVRDINLEFSFEYKKALVRCPVTVPAIFTLHYGQTNAVIVDPEDHEILVRFRYASGLLSQIDLG